jgi:hypothetical protein
MDYMAGPELPRQLAELEARWLSSLPAATDYLPRIAQLEKQRGNLIEAIKSGGLAAELGAELKALTAELEQLRALSQTEVRASRRVPQECLERRLARMLERLAKGGEVAQGVVRELFPDGIWLYPDRNGGGFLWAQAQTPILHPAGLVDAEGRSLAEGFPRVYNVIAGQARNDVRVDEVVAGARYGYFRRRRALRRAA